MTDSNLTDISDYRAVNASLCTSGQPSAEQLRMIAEAGFATIINLAPHDDPRYSLPDEARLVHALGMTYTHIPVQFSKPTEAKLLEFFAALDAHQGAKCWIHCFANKRVSVFLGLYWMIKNNWSQARAFSLMHSVWQPDETWLSFIDAMLDKYRGTKPDAQTST